MPYSGHTFPVNKNDRLNHKLNSLLIISNEEFGWQIVPIIDIYEMLIKGRSSMFGDLFEKVLNSTSLSLRRDTKNQTTTVLQTEIPHKS